MQLESTAIFSLLLDKGADPNRVGSEGNSPLATAILQQNSAAVQKLLQKGANTNIKIEGIPLQQFLADFVDEDNPNTLQIRQLLHK
jgi:ankyrin repeat protein